MMLGTIIIKYKPSFSQHEIMKVFYLALSIFRAWSLVSFLLLINFLTCLSYIKSVILATIIPNITHPAIKAIVMTMLGTVSG